MGSYQRPVGSVDYVLFHPQTNKYIDECHEWPGVTIAGQMVIGMGGQETKVTADNVTL